jgi:hypothetical protein
MLFDLTTLSVKISLNCSHTLPLPTLKPLSCQEQVDNFASIIQKGLICVVYKQLALELAKKI